MLRKPVQKGVDFVRKQQNSFKVNMARRIVQNFSIGLTQQYQSIYISELGAGPLELGYVTSLGGFASTFITVPIGWLADKHGIRKLILFSLSLFTIGYAIFAVANNWQITALALIVTTFAAQMDMTVCPMICGSTLASEERATGMQLCDTVTAVPRLLAPVTAAYIITILGGISVEGIRPIYWIEVGGLLAALLIFFKYFTNPREKRGSEPHQLISGIRRVFNEGVMVKRWIVYSMISGLPIYMAIYIPLYARELKGATQFTIGLMDTAYWLSIVLLAIPIGLSADKFGRKKLIMLMTPLYSISMLFLIRAPNDLMLILAGLLSGFIWLSLTTQVSIWGDLVPKELLGSWSGMMGLLRGIVNIISPILGGLLWNSLGPEYVLYFLAATQIVKLPILATIPSSITRG